MENNRVKEVFADEAFVKSLLELETPEEAQTALKEKGIEIGVEELIAIRDNIAAGKSGGNLSLEKLDDAAGGSSQTLATYVLTQEEIMSQLHGHSLGPVAFNGRNW